jgi:hypothetical protein
VQDERERLLDELLQPTTTHQRRAAIGDRLDQLRDYRPGVGQRADGLLDIEWCRIPPGSVVLDGASGSFEVVPFFIAKYPVTFCQ